MDTFPVTESIFDSPTEVENVAARVVVVDIVIDLVGSVDKPLATSVVKRSPSFHTCGK